MACANFDVLLEETLGLDRAGADIFHMDVSDGRFNARLSLGMQDFACVRRNTKKPVDVHLYVENPARFIPAFIDAGADILYLLPQSTGNPARDLCMIKDAGRPPGLGVLPGTAIESLYELIPLIDYMIINTAYPYGNARVFM